MIDVGLVKTRLRRDFACGFWMNDIPTAEELCLRKTTFLRIGTLEAAPTPGRSTQARSVVCRRASLRRGASRCNSTEKRDVPRHTCHCLHSRSF